jgi:hypothetical protein
MYSVKKFGLEGMKLVNEPSTTNSSATLIEAEAVHPSGEVAVTEYSPASATMTLEVVAPLFHTQVVPGTDELAINSTLPAKEQ